MISDPSQLTALVDQLSIDTWTLAAVATLFESELAEALREPRTVDDLAARVGSLPRERIARCLDVLAARGVVTESDGRYALAPGALPFARPPQRTSLLGDIRSTLMQALAYVDAAAMATPARGWYHTDRRLLQAQGDSSAILAGALAARLAPQLDGLEARLAQPSARFLDIGVGVGALAIAMCRTFPALHVVGVDLYDLPLAIARDNVARAELGGRIELRQLAVEDLHDDAGFDLAWLPAFFLTPSGIPRALERVLLSLRPGGWLLVPALNVEASGEQRRHGALVLEQWGTVTESTAIARAVEDAGFTAVRTLPGAGWLALVAGQR